MEIILTNNQLKLKQYFEPLYKRSLSCAEVKEISENIRGFLLALYTIQKEGGHDKTERIQN
ncbi:MAG: hypothetical protein US75_C0011G0018 [Candidatus Woesebacteria bacterium GW2011_GWC1_38_13]|uniref:Uncharacterized protein n=3 Tax=Candidatus Woeseibacteriota TaxID=1752722 RepID=A0A0G0L4N1_9BACT|nr:MAG: hypothetical protein US67_C0061G0003 [Candidatus Woesebacteria bacterium GW2011_GWD1_38_10]KKQ56001.1 MAG: hypothetical protein US75_C0011G0018 [Candidatus Woesebacteria bacterium GW2011_GWC1_38_13]KKQ82830.1 MAG: hypothetical protein UT06_C0035G0019 [Candidatus Woesebacteria bacterium GW2011_GWA1_38_8]